MLFRVFFFFCFSRWWATQHPTQQKTKMRREFEQNPNKRRGINENRHTHSLSRTRYLLYALIETKPNAAILFIGRPTHHIRCDASITHAYMYTHTTTHQSTYMHTHTQTLEQNEKKETTFRVCVCALGVWNRKKKKKQQQK